MRPTSTNLLEAFLINEQELRLSQPKSSISDKTGSLPTSPWPPLINPPPLMGLLASPEATFLANEVHLSVCPPLPPCCGWEEVHPSIRPSVRLSPPWQELWDVPGMAALNSVLRPWTRPRVPHPRGALSIPFTRRVGDS